MVSRPPCEATWKWGSGCWAWASAPALWKRKPKRYGLHVHSSLDGRRHAPPLPVQVFPFPVPLAETEGLETRSELAEQLEVAGLSDSVGLLDKELGHMTPEELSALKLFHRKYNKTMIDNLVLQRERARLVQENEDIKSLLQQVRLAFV
jgi:hypothetical protein